MITAKSRLGKRRFIISGIVLPEKYLREEAGWEGCVDGGGGRKKTPFLFLLVPEKNEQEIFYFYIIGIGRDVNYF